MYMRGGIKKNVSVIIKHSYWTRESSSEIIEQGRLCPLYTIEHKYLDTHLCGSDLVQNLFTKQNPGSQNDTSRCIRIGYPFVSVCDAQSSLPQNPLGN